MTDIPNRHTAFDASELNHDYWLDERNLADRTVEELKRIIIDISKNSKRRFQENHALNEERNAWRDTANNQAEVIRELKARSLATLQQRVHDWRRAAYPDTRGIELQALGVAEESGELCHAVLKYKQGIRGYDFVKTHDEVADAIGDIIIYAMGVADILHISVEEALYKTVEHVINRNITQGSDAGRPDDAGCVAHGEVDGPCPLEQASTKSKLPDNLTLEEQAIARDAVAKALSPTPIAEIVKKMPKGVDYAGHVPTNEGPSGVGCFPPVDEDR